LGVFGLALNQVFFVLGISRTSVAHAAILIGTSPILVLSLSSLRGHERITARKAIGLALALAGVSLLKTFEAHPDGRGPTWTGDLFIFLSAFTFACFVVFGKSAAMRHSSITVNSIAYISGAIAISPVTISQARGFAFASVSWMAWAGLVYMALVSSVICYLMFCYALTHLVPSRASAFSYLQPPMVTTMGVLALGERVTPALVVSAVIILTGVWLVERG